GLLAWFEEHRDEVLDMIEVREMLESRAAYQAARCASPAMVDRLRRAVTEMRSYVERGGLMEAAHADREFHRLLYEASGNRFLKLLGDAIVAALLTPRQSLLRIPGRAQRSVAEHQAIVEAIAGGDPESARRAIGRHMASVRALLSVPG